MAKARRALRLRSGTRYHYRVVATNSAGTTYGADRTFTTRAVPKITIGRPTFNDHSTVSERVHCSASSRSTCSGTVSVTIRQRAGHHGLRTVTIGRRSYRIRAGHSATVHVTLNRTGRRLLARSRRLSSTVSVALGRHVIGSRHLALRAHVARRTPHRAPRFTG